MFKSITLVSGMLDISCYIVVCNFYSAMLQTLSLKKNRAERVHSFETLYLKKRHFNPCASLNSTNLQDEALRSGVLCSAMHVGTGLCLSPSAERRDVRQDEVKYCAF